MLLRVEHRIGGPGAFRLPSHGRPEKRCGEEGSRDFPAIISGDIALFERLRPGGNYGRLAARGIESDEFWADSRHLRTLPS